MHDFSESVGPNIRHCGVPTKNIFQTDADEISVCPVRFQCHFCAV